MTLNHRLWVRVPVEPQSRTGMGETIYPSDVAGDPRAGLGTIERQFFSESEI